MKLNIMTFPLAIALAAAMATTGCHKGPPKTTMIPDNHPIVGPNGDNLSTLPPSNPFPDNNNNVSGVNTGVNPNTFAEGNAWDIGKYTQDHDALAAYTVHFAFDSAVVTGTEAAKLDIVADKLRSNPSARLLIEGNCDERGTEEYNRALGERRALALREELVKKGINADDIHTISYGKDKPADDGHDESAWAKNRRGDFVLCLPKTGV
jgi:peptidoglycan-associated lipoprotein